MIPEQVLTWEQIDNLDYRKRAAAVEARRCADDAIYAATCRRWEPIRAEAAKIGKEGKTLPDFIQFDLSKFAKKQAEICRRDAIEWDAFSTRGMR
jgi:hypothetical protein